MDFIIGKIRLIYLLFIKITTGILIAAAAYISIFYGTRVKLDSKILWAILLLSFICAIGGAIFPTDGVAISKKDMIIRQIIHYIYINISVMSFAFYLEWVPWGNVKMALGMEACILTVHLAVTIASYFSAYRMAERMNRKLEERISKEERIDKEERINKEDK